jgi:hypothetical protein
VWEAFSEDPVAVSNERVERATAGTSLPRAIQSLNSLARKKDRFFRPWLESLEERNGPGGFGPSGPPGPPPPGPFHPTPPPGLVVNQTDAINVAGDHNSAHNNSFNNMASVGGAGLLSQAQVGNFGVLFAFNSLLAAETGNTNVGTLMDDKVALAVDNYLLLPANSGALSTSGMTSRGTDVTNLPFISPAIGDLTYDFTFNSLATGQVYI